VAGEADRESAIDGRIKSLDGVGPTIRTRPGSVQEEDVADSASGLEHSDLDIPNTEGK
jgi:hypothetical protein